MKVDEIKFCNCAGCGKKLLGKNMEGLREFLSKDFKEMAEIGGRIDGRPYCNGCLAIPSSGVSGICGGASGPPDEDIGSYRTIAKRYLEDG